MSAEKKQLSPTPWKLENLFDNWVVVSAENNVINIRNNEANAKLIAAAPEMLDALQEIIKEYDIDIVKGINALKIRRVIKKATE